MSLFISSGLLTTSDQTSSIVGIAFIVIFAIIRITVDPDYDDLIERAVRNTENSIKN